MNEAPGEANGHSTDTIAASAGELIEARATTGAADERALAWLIQERRRRAEEAARTAAIRKAGDDEIHAARIKRQAAMIEAKTRGIKIDLGDL